MDSIAGDSLVSTLSYKSPLLWRQHPSQRPATPNCNAHAESISNLLRTCAPSVTDGLDSMLWCNNIKGINVLTGGDGGLTCPALAEGLNAVGSEFSGPLPFPKKGVHMDVNIVCFGEYLTVEVEDCESVAANLNQLLFDFWFVSRCKPILLLHLCTRVSNRLRAPAGLTSSQSVHCV
jgi:hypothetical protein